MSSAAVEGVKARDPIVIRLETASRYYLCAVQRDLFGGWEVWRAWGAKGSRLGNSMRCPAADEDHAVKLLADVLNVRLAHGYRHVRCSSAPAGW